MKPIVEVKNLIKNYGEKEAVKSISFKINEDEILGLLGPNGSGKTTTIGMMLGLLKPTSGDILIEGEKIEENRIEILKKINFISPYIELPKKLTVFQNLNVYARMYNIENRSETIEELIEDLNLKEIVFKKTGELSSGQKNRVALAKSLINKPELLLLDEPTASLDPDVGDYVRSYIEQYRLKNNKQYLTYHTDYNLFRRKSVINGCINFINMIDEY